MIYCIRASGGGAAGLASSCCRVPRSAVYIPVGIVVSHTVANSVHPPGVEHCGLLIYNTAYFEHQTCGSLRCSRRSNTNPSVPPRWRRQGSVKPLLLLTGCRTTT